MAALESRKKRKDSELRGWAIRRWSLIGGLDFATGTVLEGASQAISKALKAAADQCAPRAVCSITSTTAFVEANQLTKDK